VKTLTKVCFLVPFLLFLSICSFVDFGLYCSAFYLRELTSSQFKSFNSHYPLGPAFSGLRRLRLSSAQVEPPPTPSSTSPALVLPPTPMLTTALRRTKFPSYVSSQTKLPYNVSQNIAAIHYDRLDSWRPNKAEYTSAGNFTVASFNLLAPVYKRLSSYNMETGGRKRESQYPELWQSRATKTRKFFEETLFPNTDIIALQEFWLNVKYLNIFREEFYKHGYEMLMLQRTGTKLDAVVLLVKTNTFEIQKTENVYLCNMRDRVAIMAWLKHKQTGKDVIVANTHLSFPHNNLESISQVQQMEIITKVMDNFAHRYDISHVTRLVVGDFNAEMKSRVCDHLRKIGYSSCFEICPPFNSQPDSTSPPATSHNNNGDDVTSPFSRSMQNQHYGLTTFVSHRNHLKEDVGVDHIFVRPETSKAAIKPVSLVDWTLSASIEEDEEEQYYEDVLHHTHSNDSDASHSQKRRETRTHHNKSKDNHHHHNSPSFNHSHPNHQLHTSHHPSPQQQNLTTPTSESMLTEKLFVDACRVLPRNKTHQLWDDDFRISDHRPVTATIIFGKRKSDSLSNIDAREKERLC